MAIRQSAANEKLRMPSGTQVTEVTVSPSALCHYITDDELERLGEMRKEPVMEIFLWSSGAFMGALIPAIQAFAQFWRDPTKVGGIGFITVLIGVATLAVMVVSGGLWHRRSDNKKSMVDTIRGRPRTPVSL